MELRVDRERADDVRLDVPGAPLVAHRHAEVHAHRRLRSEVDLAGENVRQQRVVVREEPDLDLVELRPTERVVGERLEHGAAPLLPRA